MRIYIFLHVVMFIFDRNELFYILGVFFKKTAWASDAQNVTTFLWISHHKTRKIYNMSEFWHKDRQEATFLAWNSQNEMKQ